MQSTVRKKSEIDMGTVVGIAYPLCIVLSGYVVPGTGNTPLGIAILGFISIFIIIVPQKIRLVIKNTYEKWMIFFAVYIILNQLMVTMIFHGYSLGTTIKQLLMNIICIVVILIIPQKLDYEKMYKAYVAIGIICCVGLIFQSIQVYVFHNMTRMIIIPGLSSLIPVSRIAYLDYHYNRMRPSSFFTEPSLFSTFTAGMIILLIKEKKYAFAIIASVCIMLTTSTIGVFLVAAIWAYWGFFSVNRKRYKILVLVLFFVASYFVFNAELFSNTISKLINIDLSTNERFSSAFTILFQMPFKDILTGVGAGNVANYLSQNSNISLSNVGVTVEGYITSGFGNFIMYGLIGGITYLIICFQLLKTKNKWAKLVALLIIILSFIQTMSFNGEGILWFVLYAAVNSSDDIKGNSVSVRKELHESISY